MITMYILYTHYTTCICTVLNLQILQIQYTQSTYPENKWKKPRPNCHPVPTGHHNPRLLNLKIIECRSFITPTDHSLLLHFYVLISPERPLSRDKREKGRKKRRGDIYRSIEGRISVTFRRREHRL